MKRAFPVFLFVFLLTLSSLQLASAQVAAVPALMNFQGRLAKPDGTSVANGSYNLLLSLYNAPTGGTLWWQRNLTSVAVKNGTFATRLDFTGGFKNGATLASVFGANAVYLEIAINGAAPLTPRQQFLTVAYAMKANSVKDGSITSASIVDGTITAADIASGGFNTLAWLLNGNSGASGRFLGTTDTNPLELRVNNRRAMRYTYAEDISNGNPDNHFRSVNVLGGASNNSIGSGVVGATIAGAVRTFSLMRPSLTTCLATSER